MLASSDVNVNDDDNIYAAAAAAADDDDDHGDDDYLKIKKCEAMTATAKRIEVLAGRTRNLRYCTYEKTIMFCSVCKNSAAKSILYHFIQ